jgi:hypothetical protein
MANQHLYLLGTLHLDRHAAPELVSLLREIGPDVITVEISRFSLSFRHRAMPVWLTVLRRNLHHLSALKRGHSGIRLLIRQLRIPWEWTAASAYAVQADIRCIPVDSGNFARMELPAWHSELLSPKNLRIISSEPPFDLEQYFASRRRHAGLILRDSTMACRVSHPLSYLEAPCWQYRERVLARRIGKVAGICGRTVHVGGWTHLLTGTRWSSVADMLQPIRPEKIPVGF